MARQIPVRWRLTLWYTLVLTAIITVLALVFYFAQQRLLLDSLDDTLTSQANLAGSSVDVTDSGRSAGLDDSTIPRDGEQFLRVVDADGNIKAGTPDTSKIDLQTSAGLNLALAGHSNFQWTRIDGAHIRVFNKPIRSPGGDIAGAIQVGLADEDIRETLKISTTIALILVPIALLIAGASGYWLAGRALKPIGTIAELASDIETDSLSRRIELVLPDDEIGRLAHMFNRMLDRLEGAFIRQRQFTADASHEFRTPLTLMQTQLELALTQPRDPERDGEVFVELTKDVARLTRLASTLLMLARSDNQQLILEEDDIDIAEFLGRVTAQYAEQAAELNVTLQVNTSPGTFFADEDKITQACLNLVDNALRYAPVGTSIQISGDRAPDQMTITVEDQGRGIPAEHIPHLFDRFYREEPGREEHAGIGLGLSICKMIVDAHGGAISARSTVGSYTTMVIELPQ